jgi:hypothetical protein
MKAHALPQPTISLGELIATVSGFSSNRREVLAALDDLFRRGRVVAKTRLGRKRLKLAS